MNHPPRLIQLISDARVSELIGASKPAFLLDAEGRLLFANRASLSLLRSASAADAEATVAAERNRTAVTLRRVLEAPRDAPPQIHALAFLVAGARRTFEFACSRLPLRGGGEAVLLVGREPVGGVLDAREGAFALIDGQRDAYALLDGEGRRVHANAAAQALLGASDSIADVIPGAQRALATARAEGAAEFTFGVLRLEFLRLPPAADSLMLVGFLAPSRPSADPTEAPPRVEPDAPAAPEPNEKPDAAVVSAEPFAVPSEPVAAAEQEHRTPSRFVWQTDADGCFIHVSPELAAVVGAELAAIEGLDWTEAATLYEIDGVHSVVAAMARRDTWSGVMVTWPVEGTGLVRPVDLAALPVFDRDRHFLGYRGFGVFREARPRPKAPDRPRMPEAAPRSARSDAPPSIREPIRPAAARPAFVESPENVVPLHKLSAAEDTERPTLTASERQAFREIARAIGTRMKRVDAAANDAGRPAAAPRTPPSKISAAPATRIPDNERSVLDRLPLGLVVHRGDNVLYANRSLLEWIGVASIEDLSAAGGLDRLFSSGRAFGPEEVGEGPRPIAIRGRNGEPIPVEARLLSVPWEGEAALIYILRRAGAGIDERMEASELAMRDLEAAVREMRAILDTATDGVALIDRDGRVLGMNRSAEALFGFDSGEVEGRHFSALFAPESHRAAMDYLEGLATNGVASVLNDGREVIGRVREGGLIPLFMTLGRVGDGSEKFCAVFRDITQWKRAEEDLVHARRAAERASSAKSEFLAKISHEIRTPLNAIIGFAEVMMEERLGPIVNERYREYLKDIHASGEHLVSLINDLLDLSKIEAGKLDLAFSSVDLNEIASQSMALMQPQANRERIIIRTALSPDLPPVVADARSIRQIVLNLLSNSIRFTPPGGQVIVSTTLTDDGEVHLRVRDTGIGMTESEIKTALEPFRQIATAGRGKAGGTGLGLPLTKALVEANRASFSIKSTVNAGTLVEIAFPSTRVLAE